ncbi:MAG: hypothetical protein L0387_42245 [Acidobacteria bacterium]|nr:hypothetical protein [Acidobacteriota bacterium]MCI0718682.1 hypothetical protein [Acidobacteriota bacterium]
MMSPSRFKALALMSIVFLLGAIVGASLGTTVVSRKFASPQEAAGKPGKVKFIDKLNARLQLSPEQTGQLKIILDETHQQFGALHESVKPQFEGIRNRMRDRIREQLNDSQKQEFEVMVREYDACRDKRKRK